MKKSENKESKSSYNSTVKDFPDFSLSPNARVAIIGSGCAGLGAAWHLNRSGADVYCKY